MTTNEHIFRARNWGDWPYYGRVEVVRLLKVAKAKPRYYTE